MKKVFEVTKLMEFVDERGLELFKEAQEYNYGSVESKLIMNAKGEFRFTGFMSGNNMSAAEYEGREICLGSIKPAELSEEVILRDEITSLLDEEQQKELFDFLVNEYNIEQDDEEEEITLEDLIYSYEYDIDNAFNTLFNDIYKDELNRAYELCWDVERDKLIERAMSRIEICD